MQVSLPALPARRDWAGRRTASGRRPKPPQAGRPHVPTGELRQPGLEVTVVEDTPALVPEIRCSLLLSITRAISSSFDLDEVLGQLLETVRTVVPYDAAGIFILSKTVSPVHAPFGSHMIAGMALHGFRQRPREDDPMLKHGRGIVGLVIRTGATVIVPDVRSDPHYVEGRPTTLSEIAVPITVGGRAIGALDLESDSLRAFSKADAEILEFIANAAALSIERTLLNQEILEKKRMDGQLEVAREVQASLLPQGPPRLDGYEIAAVNIPNIQVGGDYYDYIPLAGGDLALAIADVAGKGVPAALVMASFRAALRTQLGHDPDLPGAMAAVNAFLVDFLKESEFVTAFCASLKPADGRLRYVNCGHNPPLLLRADGRAEKLEDGGTILGFSRDALFAAGEVQLHPGDLLVLYTDGVIEARGPADEDFGIEGLERVLRTSTAAGAEGLIREVIQATQTFSGSTSYADDFTLVILRRAGRA